ncbi:MAG: hypothetical protein GY714_03390 [Desulfobacterales bacterium]|nr:hypothetical protein [Desulfobacterales bacterium]
MTTTKSPQFYCEQAREREREDEEEDSTNDKNTEEDDLGRRRGDLEEALPHPNPQPQVDRNKGRKGGDGLEPPKERQEASEKAIGGQQIGDLDPHQNDGRRDGAPQERGANGRGLPKSKKMVGKSGETPLPSRKAKSLPLGRVDNDSYQSTRAELEALKEKMEEMERGHRRKIERFAEALEGMEKELNMVKREGAKAKAKLRKLNLEERDAPVEQFKRNLGGNGELRECEIGRLGSGTPQRSGQGEAAPVEDFRKNLGGKRVMGSCEMGRLGSGTPQRSGHAEKAPVCEEAANERIGSGRREESAVLSTSHGKGGSVESSPMDAMMDSLGAIAKREIFEGPAWKAPGQMLVRGDPRWASGSERRKDVDWGVEEMRKLPTEASFNGEPKEWLDFWRKVDFAADAARITEEEALVDVISRLIGDRVRTRVMTMAPVEARTNWEVFWDFLSRNYGEYDHFSDAQTEVVEYKPKEVDSPRTISRALKMRIGAMQAAWRLLKSTGQPVGARSGKALTVWQIYEKIKENIFKNSNNLM